MVHSAVLVAQFAVVYLVVVVAHLMLPSLVALVVVVERLQVVHSLTTLLVALVVVVE